MDFSKLFDMVFEDKETVKKYLPLLKIFLAGNIKAMVFIAMIECGINEIEKLCPDGACP